ncbi:MAG: hypothetical protein WCT52_03490 [Candidatus Micrarchaeia archaeon]
MLEELFLAIALAAIGIILLLASVVAPWVLVMLLGESVDSPSVWFVQLLPAVGLICIAMAALVYVFSVKKKK